MMLTVTIDQSEGISGADVKEQAVKKMRTGSAALSLPSPRAVFAFLFTNDFSPPCQSLEQAIIKPMYLAAYQSNRYRVCGEKE